MEVGLAEFVTWVLAGAIGVTGVFSVVSRIRQSGERRAEREHRVVCRVCGQVFLAEPLGELVECPFCGKLNRHDRNGRLG